MKRDSIDPREIALMAFYAWEKDGRPEGRDLVYWIEAETQLKATRHLLAREMNDVRGRTPVSSISAARPAGPEKRIKAAHPSHYSYPERTIPAGPAVVRV